MDNLLAIVEKDIKDCETEIERYSTEKLHDFQVKIEGKYQGIIDDFSAGIQSPYDFDFNLVRSNVLYNINLLKEKLELFKAMGCKNAKELNASPKVQINNTNENHNNVEISVTFEQAKQRIEEMSALTDAEVEEILEKVNRLEEIVNSNDRKTKKWENAKEIVKWIADKGVDVAITLLPLLLQIQ